MVLDICGLSADCPGTSDSFEVGQGAGPDDLEAVPLVL